MRRQPTPLRPALALLFALLLAVTGSMPSALATQNLGAHAGTGGNVFRTEDGAPAQRMPEATRLVLDTASDGAAHPYVGALMTRLHGQFDAVCSGTLVSPTVFLTAGHCVSYLLERDLPAYVSFAPQPAPSPVDTTWRLRAAQSIIAHRSFVEGNADADTVDLGIVLLAEPVTGLAPARLSRAGLLDSAVDLSRGEDSFAWLAMAAVGYGIGAPTDREPGREVVGAVRHQASVPAGRLLTDPFHVQWTSQTGRSSDHRRPDGRACTAGSGAPVLFSDSHIIVAVISFGPGRQPTCGGTEFAYRVDTPGARTFLDGFLPLP
jgi:secreted trypsin-like serine protease